MPEVSCEATTIRLGRAGDKDGEAAWEEERPDETAGSKDESNPEIDRIMACLARDLARVPSPVIAFPAHLVERAMALTAGMDVDLDEGIDGAAML